MSDLSPEYQQLQVTFERLRALLELLVVRGLRACGEEELSQLQGYVNDLETAGVAHVAGKLAELHRQIQSSDRSSPQTLILAHTSVRMLDRLLTLRVVDAAYAVSLATGYADDDDDDDAAMSTQSALMMDKEGAGWQSRRSVSKKTGLPSRPTKSSSKNE